MNIASIETTASKTSSTCEEKTCQNDGEASAGECTGDKEIGRDAIVCEVQSENSETEFPDGGFRAWGVVFGG
jgi:hypothetical protein